MEGGSKKRKTDDEKRCTLLLGRFKELIRVGEKAEAVVCLLEAAACDEDGEANAWLGKCCNEQFFGFHRHNEYVEYYKRAAELGNGWGLYEVAHRAWGDIGYYKMAMETGHLYAMAECYKKNKGPVLGDRGEHLRMSEELHRQNAELGNMFSQYEFGMANFMYAETNETHAATAVRWLRESAIQGHPGAQSALAKFPIKFYKRSITESYIWYMRSDRHTLSNFLEFHHNSFLIPSLHARRSIFCLLAIKRFSSSKFFEKTLLTKNAPKENNHNNFLYWIHYEVVLQIAKYLWTTRSHPSWPRNLYWLN